MVSGQCWISQNILLHVRPTVINTWLKLSSISWSRLWKVLLFSLPWLFPSNANQSSTEALIDSLFPSIGTSRASAGENDGNVIRFNPKVGYGIKRQKRSASSKSPNTSSSDNLEKEGRESNCKSLLKDLNLPSPQIENVPWGRFREYL